MHKKYLFLPRASAGQDPRRSAEDLQGNEHQSVHTECVLGHDQDGVEPCLLRHFCMGGAAQVLPGRSKSARD